MHSLLLDDRTRIHGHSGAETQSTDLPSNLRLLCSYYPSISHVCRKLGLNRSQFNRYLNGATTPSRFVMRQICNFFGLETHEIYLPHTEFQALISDKPEINQASSNKAVLLSAHLDKLLTATQSDTDRYLGFYNEYYYSMTYPDKILRSLMHISREGSQIVYRRYEILATPGSPQAVKCRYEGILFFLKDRMFLVDYETLTLNEMTQTILYPCFYSKVDFLLGLKLGVSALRDRQPLVRSVVLESLGTDVNLRDLVCNSGLITADDPSISGFILQNLQQPVSSN